MNSLYIFFFAFITCVSPELYNGNLKLVSDLLPQDCFDQGKDYFNEQTSKIHLPKCDKFSKPGPCAIYYKPTGTYKDAVYKPTECAKDGNFAAKQCKGEYTTGRCFCFNDKGARLFGQQWQNQAENMTCACSRKKADMADSVYFNSLHCDSMGNFEPLQCDVVSEQCWCAHDKTGDLTSPVVPLKAVSKLPCYDSSTVGSQYLRQCESKLYAQKRILFELKLHGTIASFIDFLCDDDGSYGSYTIVDGAVYCTWRDNSKIGSWASDGNDEVDCYCARDVKYFSEAGKTQSLKCEPNGNYKSYQKTSNKGYCVDKYGFRKSPSNVDVQDETSCDQYRAY